MALPSVALPKPPFAPEPDTNLFIRGLDQWVTDLQLYEAFAPYGAVTSVKVILDPATGLPKVLSHSFPPRYSPIWTFGDPH